MYSQSVKNCGESKLQQHRHIWEPGGVLRGTEHADPRTKDLATEGPEGAPLVWTHLVDLPPGKVLTLVSPAWLQGPWPRRVWLGETLGLCKPLKQRVSCIFAFPF